MALTSTRIIQSLSAKLPRICSSQRQYSMATIKASAPRFAPLNPKVQNSTNAPTLRAIVFDVDGTLCEPQNWMFQQMRDALGITKQTDIIDHMTSLPEDEQKTAFAKVKEIEEIAMEQMKPQKGLTDLMEYLDKRSVPKAICTRNLHGPVAFLISNFLEGHKFHPIITREFKPPKPSPAGILHIAKELDIDTKGSELIMVGDSIDDMKAGRGAGAVTILLASEHNTDIQEHDNTDLVITHLDELIPLLENGLLIPAKQ